MQILGRKRLLKDICGPAWPSVLTRRWNMALFLYLDHCHYSSESRIVVRDLFIKYCDLPCQQINELIHSFTPAFTHLLRVFYVSTTA